MNDTIQGMATTLLGQLQGKVDAIKATPEMEEILRLHRALNGLEDAIPRDRTTLAEVFGLGPEAAGANPAVSFRKVELLKEWEFTGMQPLQAAKHFLKKVGEPRHINEIVSAIRDHGGNPGSVDHLKTALTRSTFDVVKVSDDMYGPIEAFPHIKRTGRWNKKKGGASNGKSQASEDEPEELGEEGEEEQEIPPPMIASFDPDKAVQANETEEEGEDA